YSGDEETMNESLAMIASAMRESVHDFGRKVADQDEIFRGRSGMLLAVANLKAHGVRYQKIIPDELVRETVNRVLETGQYFSQRQQTVTQCPLLYAYHDKFYFGTAHGLNGILFTLLLFPEFLDPQSDQLIRTCVDFLISTATPSDSQNMVSSWQRLPPNHPAERSDRELVQWCHGNAGAVYLYAVSWLRWHDPKYLEASINCGNVIWERGLLQKGTGLCHGIAGNGYVFLVLYRLTKEAQWLHRASNFAAQIKSLLDDGSILTTPDNPFSLFEGLAGTASFFADFSAAPQPCSFPFMPIP
ncbi:hypothetical protein Ciccas_013634, partial [Cichlidogyrus casuarinus]